MNDEIEEILQYVIDDIYQCGEYINQAKKLEKVLDYITNLQQERDMYKTSFETMSQNYFEEQQENERLKEQLEYLRSGEYLNQVKWERDLNENLNQTLSTELEDYKSRCEKVISKIKDLYSYSDNEEYVDNYCKDLLNILQNGSDEE